MEIRKQKFRQSRINFISRKARIWSRLNKSLVKSLDTISENWLNRILNQAENDIAAGDILEIPKLSLKFERQLSSTLREAMAQGYWLQHIYLQECRSIDRGKKYRGRITLSDDDEIRSFLEKFIETGNEWHKVIPEEAIEWLKGYTPKLAGNFENDVLEKVREVIRHSMIEGSSLQERIKDLKNSIPEVHAMAKHRIEAIARTEITRADNIGNLIAMKSNSDVIGFEFSAILDDRTTDICEERHGLFMKINDPRVAENTPPLHVNCRSQLLPCTIYDFPDGLLTSHEFDDGELPETMQRDYDIQEIQALLDSFNEAVKEIVEEIPVAKTIEEANSIAVKYGVAKYADFSGLDVQAANELISAVLKNKEIFPELPIFDCTGGSQCYIDREFEARCKLYFKYHGESLKVQYPDKTDDEIISLIGELIFNNSKEEFGANAYAASSSEEGIVGIFMNTDFFSSLHIVHKI